MRQPTWGDVVEKPTGSVEKTAETALRNATEKTWMSDDDRYRVPMRKE